MNSLNEDIKVPSAKKIRDIINSEGEKLVNIPEDVEMCLMVDGWKNTNYENILNIILKQNRIIFLESVIVREKENAINLVKIISNTLAKYKVDLSRIYSIISDNNITMKRIAEIVEHKTQHIVISFGCLAHVLNIISKNILELEKYKTILEYCNTIQYKINSSKSIREIMTNSLKSENIKSTTIYHMLEKAAVQDGVVSPTCSNQLLKTKKYSLKLNC